MKPEDSSDEAQNYMFVVVTSYKISVLVRFGVAGVVYVWFGRVGLRCGVKTTDTPVQVAEMLSP